MTTIKHDIEAIRGKGWNIMEMLIEDTMNRFEREIKDILTLRYSNLDRFSIELERRGCVIHAEAFGQFLGGWMVESRLNDQSLSDGVRPSWTVTFSARERIINKNEDREQINENFLLFKNKRRYGL